MERLVTKEILDWYNTKDERILLLTGGYRIGKTWVVRSFCREYDEHYIYISMRDIEEGVGLEHMSSKATFLVIDDINNEKMLMRACQMILRLRSDEVLSEYRVIMISAMIYLDDYVKDIVGAEYVRFIRMQPMNFGEFAETVKGNSKQDGVAQLDNIDILKMYMVVGGMPECVSLLLQEEDLISIRRKQWEIVSRICGNLAGTSRKTYTKEQELLGAITTQNMTNTAGFSLRQVGMNARVREYGAALGRLEQYGLIHRVSRFGAIDEDGDISSKRIRDCKLYVTDVGLAGAIAFIDEKLILQEDKLFVVGNGLLYRTYVLQEYLAIGMDSMWELCYWHKQRAKARLPLILKGKTDGSLVLINIIIPKQHTLTRSIQSFLKEYPQAKIVDLSPVDVTCSNLWHNIL